MAKLQNTTEEYVKALEECIDECILKTISLNDVKALEDETIKQIKSLLHCLDMANEVMLEQAKALDDLSDRMDLVIKMLRDKE